MTQEWKETAWNGISFRAPPEWEVGQIGRRYLLLETLHGPQLEIKWASVKGRFSMKRQLKRLAGMQDRAIRKAFQVCPIPEEWADALEGFSATAFLWEATHVRGQGLLLFCPQCRTATLIQFYSTKEGQSDTVAPSLLRSFRDHGHTRLAVFDIRAELPEGVLLEAYRFNAGEFELTFRGHRHRYTLYRWGPAAVLLEGQSLSDFVTSRLNMTGLETLTDDDTRLEGHGLVFPSLGRRLWNRLRKVPSFRWMQFWHDQEKNKLLGLDISGPRPMDPKICTRLATSYESL